MTEIKIPGLIAKELKDSEKDPKIPDKYDEAMKSFSTTYDPTPPMDLIEYQQQAERRLQEQKLNDAIQELAIKTSYQLHDAQTKEEFKQWMKSAQIQSMINQVAASQNTTLGYVPTTVTTNVGGSGLKQKPLTRRMTQSNPYIQTNTTSNWGFDSYQRPAFEEMIDLVFDLEEKVSFLETLGYKLDPSYTIKTQYTPVYHPDHSDDIKYTVTTAFLKEITIKFKNLLLAKPSLKIKF